MLWIDVLLLEVPKEKLHWGSFIAVWSTDDVVDAQQAQHLPSLNRNMVLCSIQQPNCVSAPVSVLSIEGFGQSVEKRTHDL